MLPSHQLFATLYKSSSVEHVLDESLSTLKNFDFIFERALSNFSVCYNLKICLGSFLP